MLGFPGRKVEELSAGHAVDLDLHTGAAALRVPAPEPPRRRGLTPQLTLVYTSGEGNAAFGAGWELAGLPAIRIDRWFHVPNWDGRDGYQFGGEELEPLLMEQGGAWTPRGFTNDDWSVAFLRGRRGSIKARVEKCVQTPTGPVDFRTRDAGNVASVYGARPDAAARVADPNDEARPGVWLLSCRPIPTGRHCGSSTPLPNGEAISETIRRRHGSR
jgi:Salmonella virulence plasmid 65kDa B protein